VLKDPSPGAPDPATLIHFQSLEPAAADGSRTVYLTSQGFDMPVGDPTAITPFTPENLCVHQDGAFDLNEIGGYAWGGSLAAPINLQYYPNGTPFEVFAPARTSSTARYTADNGTNNGATLSPSGSTTQGEELLMQVVLATGDDRSQSCGGPRRHPDGTLVVTAPLPTAMHIREQRAYVSNNRSLAPTAFCPSGVPSCVGTATLTSKGKKIASARFTAPASKTAHIAMKLSPAAFRAMKKAKGHALRVTFTIVTSVGTYTHLITIRH
jgi:hypothetical protein